MEDQAFLPSDVSAPRPPPSPQSPISKLALFLSLPVCRVDGRAHWREVVGGRGGGSYDDEKACSFINYSILSALQVHANPPPPAPNFD
jgi:hypothetical protein